MSDIDNARTDCKNRHTDGTPYAPHTDQDVEAMLAAVGVDSVESLFDIPPSVRYDGEFEIDAASEQSVRRQLGATLARNDELTEFLGRGHYSHYVPSIVDTIAQRSEFITSYTQYLPEITQGFLQALFEYQSILVELTGRQIANCSMYDAATALGETALLAERVRETTGSRILVPDYIRQEHRDVLENYVTGTALTVTTFSTEEGATTPERLESELDDDVVLVHIESPTPEGVIEEHLDAIGDQTAEYDALFSLGSDPVALSILQDPASIGVDVVVGDASVLGLPTAYGMGLGFFACRDSFLRQVPGRLIGATEDNEGNRAYTLTLQTREQHIRRERATSNICTNQAWVALRTVIHAAYLGASGLVSLAKRCHELPTATASQLDEIDGITAPVYDRYHFREFTACIDTDDNELEDAEELAAAVRDAGFAIHVRDDETIQICVTDTNDHRVDDFVDTVAEVMG